METKSPQKSSPRMYPPFVIDRIQNPSKLYALPIIGFVIKLILLIPVFIEMMFLGIAYFFVVVLMNPFVVLFTGKYWDTAYTLNVSVLRLSTKMTLYLFGLTNSYPGFDFTIHDSYTVEIAKPTNLNKLFAIPVLGGMIRVVLLIPYFIYGSVLGNGSYVGAVVSSFVVLFKGEYPESVFEFIRDYTRVSLASSVYVSGLSDTYPSFYISMNHQTIKILLIIAGALLAFSGGGGSPWDQKDSTPPSYYDSFSNR